MRRRILSALCCVLLLSVLATAAFAAEIPDPHRRGSISVTMTCLGEAVPGGTLTLYRVAEVHVENGADYSFRYTPEYAGCQASLDALSDSATAVALAEYTADNDIAGTEARIDENGAVTFPGLELGVYLLVQHEAAAGYVPAGPFLVTVPGRSGEAYVYDVDASPKLSLEPAPTEPTEPPTEPPTRPTEPELPQTGLNRWPVPVLAVSGLILIALGLVFCAGGRKKPHED